MLIAVSLIYSILRFSAAIVLPIHRSRQLYTYTHLHTHSLFGIRLFTAVHMGETDPPNARGRIASSFSYDTPTVYKMYVKATFLFLRAVMSANLYLDPIFTLVVRTHNQTK